LQPPDHFAYSVDLKSNNVYRFFRVKNSVITVPSRLGRSVESVDEAQNQIMAVSLDAYGILLRLDRPFERSEEELQLIRFDGPWVSLLRLGQENVLLPGKSLGREQSLKSSEMIRFIFS
jgi:hypothetical protein